MKKLLAVFFAAVMVLAFASYALAADLYLGGDFTLKHSNSGSDPFVDGSDVGWWSLNIKATKTFGENGSAYLQISSNKGMRYDPNQTPEPTYYTSLDISGYGYTYKFSDALSLTWANESGDTLSNGLLVGTDEWKKDEFGRATKIRVVGTPVEGLSATAVAALCDETYLVKGEYAGEGFKVGGGYSNKTSSTWDVYGELGLIENLTVYGEYNEDGEYLVKGTYAMDPYTFNTRYANVKSEWGYVADTLEASVDYKLDDVTTISGGLGYKVTTPADLSSVFAKVVYDKYTAKVTYDFGAAAAKLYGAYKFDGSNSLEFEYNLGTNVYTAKLYISLW